MNQLKKYISEQIHLNERSLEHISSMFDNVEIEKGDYFLNTGEICNNMAFIASGYLRMYNIVDGKEVTFWISGPNKFITSLSSFVFQTPNFWNIQAITECKLKVITKKKHIELYETERKWIEFDNRLLAHSFALLEKSMFAQLHTNANERFTTLLKEQPDLFQHVPLQYIASMIGITPESLSRLRKKLANSFS